MASPPSSNRRRRIVQGCAILAATTGLILCVCLALGVGTTSVRVVPDSQGVSLAFQPGWRPTTTAEVYATQTGEFQATRTQFAANLYATGTQVADQLETAQADILLRTATASALQATGTQLGVLQATAQERGTRTAHEATITAGPGATVTARANLLAEVESWRVVLSDDFDAAGGWLVGSFDDEWGSAIVSVEDGVYLWDITNSPDYDNPPGWWSIPYERRDHTFALSVDVRNVEGPASAYFGLVFHLQEYSWADFYTVIFSDGALVEAYWVDDGEWEDLLSERAYEAIRPDQRNHLVVIAQDNQYDVYINDEWIGMFQHTSISEGWLGLFAGAVNPGERVLIEFDNFEFRIPR